MEVSDLFDSMQGAQSDTEFLKLMHLFDCYTLDGKRKKDRQKTDKERKREKIER